MDEFIASLFGAPPDYSSALTPQQTQQMQSNALAQGGIGALIALLGASGPQARPISTGQALAGALGAGFGGYQSSFDNTLKQLLTAQQLGENKRKLERQAAFEKAMQGATTMQPQNIPMATTPGSQLDLLSRPEFGGDMAAAETVGALRANLPTTPRIDFDKFVQAIAASGVDPIEAAKLMRPTETKLTGSVGEFQEAKRLGIIPETMSFPEFKTMGKGPLVTVSPGDTELEKLDAKQVSAISDRVNSARAAANTANSINSLLVGKGGGEVVKIGANLAQTLGIQSETASANALAQALQVNAATQVRAAGSGSTSDLEFKSFLSVFPSLGNSEQGRKLMAQGLQAFADRDAAIERKARELLKAKTYSAGALAEYDASLGPVLDPKKFGDLSKFAPSSGTAKPPRLDLSQPAKPAKP
jgi:hypothetical protein